MARNTSSNFAGASDSFSVLRVATFFFRLSFCTNPFSAPAWHGLVLFYQPTNLTRQSIPLYTLAVGEPLPFDLIDKNLHALAISNLAIVPAKFNFVRVTVKVLAADVVECANDAALDQREETFRRVDVSNAAILVLSR